MFEAEPPKAPENSRMASLKVQLVPLRDIESLREAFRAEMNFQVVHDSIHERRGWTREYVLLEDDHVAGYASVAVDGPWRNRPTFYEMYLTPEHRLRAHALFECFLLSVGPLAFEVQSSDSLTTAMALTFARDIATEKVVFRDDRTTLHLLPGSALRSMTPAAEIREAIELRQGGGEWQLLVDDVEVGRGGLLFHYNRPYGDIYMDINEEFRRQGFGTYLVQELKRLCYELGGIPAARSDPGNTASHRTLQKAGFIPYAHILVGSFREA